jgi:hypothetical protein
MQKALLISLFLFVTGGLKSYAQKIIFDARHFAIVNENGLTREAAENTHQNSLDKIKQDLDNINLNLSSVVLVQDMIHRALSTVDGTLKDGLAVRQVVEIVSDIITQGGQITDLAKGNPLLLLFAQQNAEQMKTRGINLISEVSAFILKEGDNVLMDYEKRDFLLRKVILDLQVMRALSYSIYKTMYFAKLNGVLKSANPFHGFINQDTHLADQVLLQYQLLKP